MSAPCDFDPVADATLYLANDIPVPYYPDQEPKTDWMAVKLEAVKDFLRKQEVYAPLIRRTQPNTEPAAASLTAKGKECAKSPTVKTKLADDHGLPPASLMRLRPTNPESSTTVMQPPSTSSNQDKIPSHLLTESPQQAGIHLLAESSQQAGTHLLAASSQQAGTDLLAESSQQAGTDLLAESSQQAGTDLLAESSQQAGTDLLAERSQQAGISLARSLSDNEFVCRFAEQGKSFRQVLHELNKVSVEPVMNALLAATARTDFSGPLGHDGETNDTGELKANLWFSN
ncbi:hypothetical protein PCASD_20562 [Puccinia coronata f. sp. avenae]|uniref:Uncharacterized protein n=1 Tax=Puccinia coronata f. sp. avenae TaxID=200324 RepID=A0A2N5U809_9BASI|nr:hypothetical protein PCASD_20562 [Puccinia coronata f. sp. avenae]